MSNEYAIRITIDSRDVQAQAARVRRVIESEIAQIATVSLDTSALERALSGAGQLSLGGGEIAGLESAVEQIQELRSLVEQPLVVRIVVESTGLDDVRDKMAKIREDAGGLGRAVAAGLGRQADALERHLAEIESRITGIVSAGKKVDIDAPLEGMEQLGEALSEDEKKAYNLQLKLRGLDEESRVLNKRFAELGAQKVMPLGGGELQPLSELFRMFDAPHVRRKVKSLVAAFEADEELRRLGERIAEAEARVQQEIEQGLQDMIAAADRAREELEIHLAKEPPGVRTLPAEMLTEEQREWIETNQILAREYERRQQELYEAKAQARFGAESQELRDLRASEQARRQFLIRQMSSETAFWKEWALGSVEEIAQALRHQGQTAEAEALEEMYAIWKRRKRVEEQLKRGRGRLVKGAQVELPKEAKGTMVDLVNAERVLGKAAEDVTKQLAEQRKELSKLIIQLDQAAMAADGFGEAQRMAFMRLQKLATREITKRTPLTKTTIEEASDVSVDVLARLSREAQRVRETVEKEMQATLDPVQETATEIAESLASQQIEEAAARPARGIVALWQRVRDILVGHSIIPDMVNDINAWLARIGVESPFAELTKQGKTAADTLVNEFAQLAEAIPADRLAERIDTLTAEINALGQEMEALTLRGRQAPQGYRAGYGTAEETLQTPGTLPGVQGIEATQRLSAEDMRRMDELWSAIASKQAQLAALLRAQLAQASETYAAKLNDVANEDQFEQLYRQLEATGHEMEAAERRMGEAIAGVQERVAAEIAREAEAAEREARARARSPIGRAEAEERIAAAKAAAEREKQLYRQTTAVVRETEKRKTAEVVTEARIRQKKVEEAEKRVTAQIIAEARAQQRQREEAAKRETAATRAAAKVAVEEAQAVARARAESEKRATIAMRHELKARERAEREAAIARRREEMARGLALEAGVDWNTYVQGALAAGRSVDEIIGALRRVRREQREAEAGARRMGREYERGGRGIGRLVAELNKARTQAYGINMLITEIGQMGRSLQFAGTALTGSLTMAAKSYLELARETDAASRSLLLNQELTQQMRESVIALAGEIGMLDPQDVAQGVTIWAQATGQAIENGEQLNRVLEQTVPVQQLAALTGIQMGTASDAVAASLRQFRLGMSETERVVAIFNKVADDTLATVPDVAEAFKYVGPQAAEMGESIEDVAAAIGIMAEQNIRGSQAGRAYRQMMISLVNPTGEVRERLEELFGTEQPFYDAQGQFIGLANVIDMLAGVTEDMTDAERDMLLTQLFSANALPAVTALVAEQTEGRERNINVMRAEAKLQRGIIDSEVREYARLQEASSGVSIAMMGALDLWDRQVEDYTESDAARVQQMEIRWKAFWLAIGQSVLNEAMPALEAASSLITRITDMIQTTPGGKLVGEMAAAGVGILAIGTLASTSMTVARAVAGLRVFVTAAQRMADAQTTAGTQFQTAVTAAGERFAQIVTAAAETAAATEVEGAEAETLIETQGAEAEAAIEVQSAGSVAGQLGTVAGKLGNVIGLLGRVWVTWMVGEQLSQQLTGQRIEQWFTNAEGVAAGEAAATEFSGLSRAELRDKLDEVSADLEIVKRFYEEYGPMSAEVIFGTGQGYGRYEEIMGGRMRALSGSAVYDKLAELETMRNTLLQLIGETYAGVTDQWTRHRDVVLRDTDALSSMTDAIWHQSDAVKDRINLSEEEQKAVDLYIELLRKQAEEIERFNDAMQEALNDLNDELAEMALKHAQEMAEERRKFQEDERESAAEHNRQMAKQRRDHDLKMRRMEEDHLMRMSDLAQQRDALGMVRERRQYDLQRRRAEEDFAISQGDAEAQFNRERERRREEHEARMREREAEYEEERRKRRAEYEERKAELEKEHRETMSQLRQEYFNKINAELDYYKRSQAEQNAYHAAMLADARSFLANNRQLWNNYLASFPTPSQSHGRSKWPRPSGGGMVPGYQTGGYVARTGVIYAHAGEYVLSRSTVDAIERGLGPLTQSRMVAGMERGIGGSIPRRVSIQQNFTFHGSMSVQERQWFRQVARREAEAAFQETLQGVVAMRG